MHVTGPKALIDDPTSECSMLGSLSAWPLKDILLWLHATRRTAMLRVGSGLDAGVVFFKDGLLYRTEWGQRTGLDALTGLLGCTQERFWLIMRDVPQPRPNIGIPTDKLLTHSLPTEDNTHQRV